MENMAEQITSLLEKSYTFDENENGIIKEIFSGNMNFPRIKCIAELIINMKLDKTSMFAFLVYQYYKVEPQKAEILLERLTKEEQEIVYDFKMIKDLNQLTPSEEIEDIKRLFLVMGKDLRVVIIKLFGIFYDISILNNPLDDAQKSFIKQVRDIHVPLSERLGLDKLKQMLYDNVIRLEYPEEYNRLKIAVESKEEENSKQLMITKAKLNI